MSANNLMDGGEIVFICFFSVFCFSFSESFNLSLNLEFGLFQNRISSVACWPVLLRGFLNLSESLVPFSNLQVRADREQSDGLG